MTGNDISFTHITTDPSFRQRNKDLCTTGIHTTQMFNVMKRHSLLSQFN